MKLTARVLELALVFVLGGYSLFATRQWIRAERKASYAEGRWAVYESFAEDSKGLKKW